MSDGDTHTQYAYEYPRPMVTVDAVVLRAAAVRDAAHAWPEVLLIARGKPPFEGRWALPGGFVEMDEDLPEAALRELAEETAIRTIALKQLGAWGTPGRDPRGRTISIVYIGVFEARANADAPQAKAGDDAADAQWFSLTALPELAFDHDDILNAARTWWREHMAQRRDRYTESGH